MTPRWLQKHFTLLLAYRQMDKYDVLDLKYFDLNMKSIRFPDLQPMAPLLVFEAAAYHQNFTKAASELSMIHRAVAHHTKTWNHL